MPMEMILRRRAAPIDASGRRLRLALALALGCWASISGAGAAGAPTDPADPTELSLKIAPPGQLTGNDGETELVAPSGRKMLCSAGKGKGSQRKRVCHWE